MIRSLLFTPASREDLVAKFERVPADAFAIDLEDGLAPAARPEARARLGDLVAQARTLAPRAQVWVRVNAVGTADFEADCAAVRGSGCQGVVLAKAESERQVEQTAAATALPVLGGIESVEGVFAARSVARAASLGLYFGAEDYVADLGGVRTAGGEEVLYARSHVAMAARSAGLPALDLVTIDIRDDSRFDRDAASGRALGFTGKMCITPRQVEAANRAYRPTPEAVATAERLIAEYENAKARGVGVIEFEGRMVDEPLLRQSRAILAAAQ